VLSSICCSFLLAISCACACFSDIAFQVKANCSSIFACASCSAKDVLVLAFSCEICDCGLVSPNISALVSHKLILALYLPSNNFSSSVKD
jgi:hypothetical protein